METLEKNIVATLKAEIINEFEFIPKEEIVNRFSNETIITHPYKSHYEAKVAVKVGNAVKNLFFSEKTKYISGFTNENGEFKPGFDVNHIEVIDETGSTQIFEELENAGIRVDYMDVLMQYKQLLEKAKYHEKLLKRWNEWEKIREGKKKLKNSWIHDFENVLKSDKNKKIQSLLNEVTFEPSTKYNKKHYVNLIYKGVVVPIHKIAGSFVFNNEKYEYELKPYEKETRNRVELEEDKLRRAKREGTIFLKAIEAIEIREKQIEYRKNKRIKELKELKDTKEHFEKVLGFPVHVEETLERSSYSNNSYKVHKYWLITKQPERKYASFEGIRLGKYEKDGVYTYSINGTFKLDEDKFKRIIRILLEGKKVHEELIIPED